MGSKYISKSISSMYPELSFIGGPNDSLDYRSDVFTGVDNVFVMKPYTRKSNASGFEPTTDLVVLDNIVTMSMSTNAERSQVRVNGKKTIAGMTVGPLTIAGTIVSNYTVSANLLNSHPFFSKSLKSLTKTKLNSDMIKYLKSILEDNASVLLNYAAPFDLYIRASNETGMDTGMLVFGMSLVSGAEVRNVHDLTIEITYQYLAYGATQSMPSKVSDYLVSIYNNKWSDLVDNYTKKANTYGFLNLGDEVGHYGR